MTFTLEQDLQRRVSGHDRDVVAPGLFTEGFVESYIQAQNWGCTKSPHANIEIKNFAMTFNREQSLQGRISRHEINIVAPGLFTVSS